MFRLLIPFLLFVFVSSSFSQEICNNGIDDDGDFLIDLNDNECLCNSLGTSTPASLIPNPSFENFTCCPFNFSDLYCAVGWEQATDATSDYLNVCGFAGVPGPSNIVPFPDGNGGVGFYGYTGYSEYVGTCLTSPMIAGTQYTLQMEVMLSGIIQLNPSSCFYTTTSPTIDLYIFGNVNCGNFPVPGFQCPMSSGLGYIEVASAALNTQLTGYQTLTFTFTPTVTISEIMIGPPCIYPPGWYNNPFLNISDCFPYFVADNLILNTTSSFNSINIGQQGLLCNNDLVISATVTDLGGTFQWFSEGVAIVGQTSSSLNVSTLGLGAGTYQASYNLNGECYLDSIVVVNSIGNLLFVNNAEFCQGQSAVLTATGGMTYDWFPNTGLNSTSGPSVVASPNQTVNYTVSSTADNGCVSTASSLVTVNVGSPINVNNGEICPGDSVVLTASGGVNYDWLPSNGLNVTSGSTVTASPSATTSYTISSTDNNGCSSTATSLVIVNTVAEIDVNDAEICEGQSAVLTATGGINYDWSPSDGLNTISGSIVTSAPNETITYTVSSIDSNDCVSLATSTVIINLSSPINVTNAEICPGDTAELVVSGGTDYIWTPSTGLSSSTGAAVNASPNQTTSYTVNSTDVNGCVSEATSIVTVVSPASNIEIIISPIPVETEATLLATPISSSYTWTDPDGLILTQNPISYLFPEGEGNFTFTVQAEDEFGCIHTENVTISITSDLIVYVPNSFSPDFDEFNSTFNPVLSDNIDSQEYSLLIFNRWGELIFESNDPSIGWDGTYDGRLVQSGTYTWTLKIKAKNKDDRKRFNGTVNVLR